jgi:hypothetical protein
VLPHIIDGDRELIGPVSVPIPESEVAVFTYGILALSAV